MARTLITDHTATSGLIRYFRIINHTLVYLRFLRYIASIPNFVLYICFVQVCVLIEINDQRKASTFHTTEEELTHTYTHGNSVESRYSMFL